MCIHTVEGPESLVKRVLVLRYFLHLVLRVNREKAVAARAAYATRPGAARRPR